MSLNVHANKKLGTNEELAVEKLVVDYTLATASSSFLVPGLNLLDDGGTYDFQIIFPKAPAQIGAYIRPNNITAATSFRLALNGVSMLTDTGSNLSIRQTVGSDMPSLVVLGTFIKIGNYIFMESRQIAPNDHPSPVNGFINSRFNVDNMTSLSIVSDGTGNIGAGVNVKIWKK